MSQKIHENLSIAQPRCKMKKFKILTFLLHPFQMWLRPVGVKLNIFWLFQMSIKSRGIKYEICSLPVSLSYFQPNIKFLQIDFQGVEKSQK